MEGLKQYGFDWGANTRGGKSSIASTCRHDNIFLRLGPGRFTLRALPGALDNVDASATCSRQELEVRTVNSHPLINARGNVKASSPFLALNSPSYD